jgi:hypothetical protein
VWICKLRKDYSPNSDIWDMRRHWNALKPVILQQLNEGVYEFSPLDRYEFDDVILSLWSSKDMVALKLITQALQKLMGDALPATCYHVKGHGGLKKAVHDTTEAIPHYTYLMRSDIKGYYESIDFHILWNIIETYVKNPVLLRLVVRACCRTETRGGNFYDYHTKSIPMGSPLSPLLGAIALIPLDNAMGGMKNIFYA